MNFMTQAKSNIAVLALGGMLAAMTTPAAVINWDLNSSALASNPPVLILRSTAVTNRTGGVSCGEGADYRLEFQNVSLRLLLASAFGGEEHREVLPAALPQGNFDFMYTLPGEEYGWPDGLKAELKRQLGVTAHFETRMTRVRLLTAPGLNTNLFRVTSAEDDRQEGNFRNVVFRGAPMDALARWMEAVLDIPVLDRTGLTNHFDVAIRWRPKHGQTEAQAIEEALRKRYGFQFIETKLPLRVLVVECPRNR